jgi:prefoldin subunit 5
MGNNQDALLKRIDELMGRLDQLEKKNKADSQNEILMFVGTGLFLLMSFELFSRH